MVVAPIGIYYVGAVLKENHYDVEILNWNNINETPEKIEKTLLEKKTRRHWIFYLAGKSMGGD